MQQKILKNISSSFSNYDLSSHTTYGKLKLVRLILELLQPNLELWRLSLE
jgi:hypothetical protein